MAKIEVTSYGTDYITVKVSELSTTAKHIEFHIDGVNDKYYALSGTSKSHTYSGLSSGTTYTLSALVYDSNWKLLTFSQNSVTQKTESADTMRIRYCNGSSSSYTDYLESHTLTTPSVSGWTFVGWATSTSTSSVTYEGGDRVYPDYDGQTLTLYAVYRYNTTSTITCYYDVGMSLTNKRTRYRWRWQTGTSSYSTSNYTMNYMYLPNIQDSVTTTTPGRSWEPHGWRTDTTASSYEYQGGVNLSSAEIGSLPTAVYAVYRNSCSITYNANGGSGSMGVDSGYAYYNTSGNYSTPSFNIDACTFTPPSGKQFSHWAQYADGSGTIYQAGDSQPTNYNVIFYAIWITGRPKNWSWTTNVSKGAAMRYTGSGSNVIVKPLTATEWLNFIDRIEAFYTYKGKTVDSTYVYRATNGVTSGSPMTVTQANGARYLINQLNPPTSVPASVTIGSAITAAFVNGLKNSLNSIE